MKKSKNFFHRFAVSASEISGQPIVFFMATLSVLVWLLTGPVYQFSDTWQLIVNTVTNIVEFLLLFIIQNTQNRENKSINLKLDELIRANKRARNSIIDLDSLSDEQVSRLEKEYKKISKNHQQ